MNEINQTKVKNRDPKQDIQRLTLLANVLIWIALTFIETLVCNFIAAPQATAEEVATVTQINNDPTCGGPAAPLDILSNGARFLQTVHFSQPAATIQIGLPVADSSVANQTWIQIGQRNAYSPQIIPGTLSDEYPLTYDASSGIGYTPYFSYTVSPSKSYLIQVRTKQADGLLGCDVLRGGYYEQLGVYITGIEVYSSTQRVDPYGSVVAGSTLRIVVRLNDPNAQWASIEAHLSYRVNSNESGPGEWLSAGINFTLYTDRLEADWTLPIEAAVGQYDLKVDIGVPNDRGQSWQELAEFTVAPDGNSTKSEGTLSPAVLTSHQSAISNLFPRPITDSRKGSQWLPPFKNRPPTWPDPGVDLLPTSTSQPDFLIGIYIPGRDKYMAPGELVLVNREEEVWLLVLPLDPENLEYLYYWWTINMWARMQGSVWINLPPSHYWSGSYLSVWFPEIPGTPGAFSVAWVIPADSKLGPYDVRIAASNSDGSWTDERVITGLFTVVEDALTSFEQANGFAYYDQTHQHAFPVIVEATPHPVDYSIAYIDSSHIQPFPGSNVAEVRWKWVTSTGGADLPVNAADYAIALSDLDGDGEPEIIRALENMIEARRIDGTPVWSYPLSVGADQLFVDDIDSDGKPEIIVTTLMNDDSFGSVVVLSHDGNLKWQNHVYSNAHGIAVWHPDPDLPGQVIVGTCGNMVYVFSHEGTLLNETEVVTGEWSSIDSLAVGDVDGDGNAEFVLGVWEIRECRPLGSDAFT